MCICFEESTGAKWGIAMSAKDTKLTSDNIDIATADEVFILMCRRLSDNSEFTITSDLSSNKVYVTYKVLRRFEDTDNISSLLEQEYRKCLTNLFVDFQNKYIKERSVPNFGLSVYHLYIGEEIV